MADMKTDNSARADFEHLKATLLNRDPQVQQRAVDELLARSHSDFVEYLLDKISTNPERTHSDARAALHILTTLIGKQQIPGPDWLTDPLLRALNDQGSEVRIAAIMGLQNLHEQRAVSQMIDLLQDKGVRLAAARALGSIGDATAADSLFAHVNDIDATISWACIESLADLGDSRASLPLIDAVLSKETHPDIRNDAIDDLRKLSDERIQSQLVTALRNSSSADARGHAAYALSLLENEESIEPLTLALQDKDVEVRCEVIDALREFGAQRLRERGGEQLVTRLISILRGDKHKDMRIAAAGALGQIADPKATEPLIAALDDKDDRVSDAALRALKWLVSKERYEQIVDEWERRRK